LQKRVSYDAIFDMAEKVLSTRHDGDSLEKADDATFASTQLEEACKELEAIKQDRANFQRRIEQVALAAQQDIRADRKALADQ